MHVISIQTAILHVYFPYMTSCVHTLVDAIGRKDSGYYRNVPIIILSLIMVGLVLYVQHLRWEPDPVRFAGAAALLGLISIIVLILSKRHQIVRRRLGEETGS